ncbi:D-3-phosphoglycerate dehydrogenase (EC [Olavius sp. associated proteobacterium Delta 1]|nr:D-3-phosphoglycerate dehydrogenase (EC [Olavius sp. associated proteobacterium Delta 1]
MNVLLPQAIEPEAIALLDRENCTITTAPDPKPETVLPLIKDAHGLILRTGITITPDLIEAADRLMVISRTGGGLDNVDVAAASEKGIIVTSNLGVNTVSVAEHVLSMMLILSKRLSTLDHAVRNGNFAIRYQNLPRDINGKTIGLMGFGRIGCELGKICRQAFDMQVIAYDPYLAAEKKNECHSWVRMVELKEMLSKSDFISIHVPLTDQTRDLVDEAELSLMKSDAILINASRGGVVNETALIKALESKKIAGAGLDVFSEEPVSGDNPLLKLENVILTPHTAALTRECVARMATEAATCVLDVFAGREPRNVANPKVLESGRWKHNRAFESAV